MKVSRKSPAERQKCALCGQHSQLRKSHLLPEFLYRSLYDDKHRLEVLSVNPDERARWQEQKGLRERLLCSACEQKIGRWERYASLVLHGGVRMQVERSGDLVRVSGLDYTKFKLFQLSILWRASVSQLAFFKEVQLGPHENELRGLLLREDPGDPDRYGCLMYGVANFTGGEALTDLIVKPSMVRVQGGRGYRFVFGGFLWQFLVMAEKLTGDWSQAVLRSDGSALFLIKPAQSMPELNSFAKELVRMNRVPA